MLCVRPAWPPSEIPHECAFALQRVRGGSFPRGGYKTCWRRKVQELLQRSLSCAVLCCLTLAILCNASQGEEHLSCSFEYSPVRVHVITQVYPNTSRANVSCALHLLANGIVDHSLCGSDALPCALDVLCRCDMHSNMWKVLALRLYSYGCKHAFLCSMFVVVVCAHTCPPGRID